MNGQALKGMRIMKGFTQKRLSEALGITQASYSRKERNLQKFSLPEVVELMKVLELTAYEADAIFFNFQLTKNESVKKNHVRNETRSKSIIKLIG